MVSSSEKESYANPLSKCSEFFFAGYKKAMGAEPGVARVANTMKDFISLANTLEDVLENCVKGNQEPVSIPMLQSYIPSFSIFDIMQLCSPISSDGARIVSSDFPDNRQLPDGYTFGQYRERIPLLSSLLPQIRSQEVQDSIFRPIAISKIQQMIDSNKDLIKEAPQSMGGLAAKAENPVLSSTLQLLSQKAQPPVGANTLL